MNEAKQGSAATAQKSVPFKQMSRSQKFVFICKLTLMIASFGFIYSNVLNE